MRRILFLTALVVGFYANGFAQTAAKVDTTKAAPAKTADGRQIIKFDAAEVEGKLSKPQVVFLLQHNEHTFRTFDIEKDVSKQLSDYVPKRKMQTRFKIFYEDYLRERVW